MKLMLSLILITHFYFSLEASTYLGAMFFGDEYFIGDAHSLSMGFTGLACNNSPLTLQKNPANILLSGKNIFQFNSHASFLDEGINTTLEENRYNHFNEINFTDIGLIVPVLSFAGLGLATYHDLDFNYYNGMEKLDSALHKAGVYDYNQKGHVQSYSVAVSLQIIKKVYFGWGFDYLSGGKQLINRINQNLDKEILIQNKKEEQEIEGYRMKYGLNIRVKKEFIIGVIYHRPYVVNFQGDEKDLLVNTYHPYQYSIMYPSKYGVGIAYYFLSGYDTLFTWDIIYNPWKEEVTSFPFDLPSLYNTTELHFGIEHNLSFPSTDIMVPLRYGILWLPSCLDRRVEMVMFTVGCGIQVSHVLGSTLKVDLGMGFGHRNFNGIYKKEPYNLFEINKEIESIRESLQLIKMSLKIEF